MGKRHIAFTPAGEELKIMPKHKKGYMADCVMWGREKAAHCVIEEKSVTKAAVKERQYVCWLCNADCGSKTALLAHLYAHKMAYELQAI